jgi:tetratricopeptide (TPR) repeat protein
VFELLLQADKALADGLLDQAERTYWQLIDLDPSNAIAMSGLARIALERGDEKAARDFADRALAIDGESIAARRVLDTVSNKGKGAAAKSNDLPIAGAEQLDAMSRRRTPVAGDRVEPAPRSAKQTGSRPARRPAARQNLLTGTSSRDHSVKPPRQRVAPRKHRNRGPIRRPFQLSHCANAARPVDWQRLRRRQRRRPANQRSGAPRTAPRHADRAALLRAGGTHGVRPG